MYFCQEQKAVSAHPLEHVPLRAATLASFLTHSSKRAEQPRQQTLITFTRVCCRTILSGPNPLSRANPYSGEQHCASKASRSNITGSAVPCTTPGARNAQTGTPLAPGGAEVAGVALTGPCLCWCCCHAGAAVMLPGLLSCWCCCHAVADCRMSKLAKELGVVLPVRYTGGPTGGG